jgi:hypothetical protein
LLALGQWFSPGTPASSITKTGRHDIAEILLKVVFNTKKSINQSVAILALIKILQKFPNLQYTVVIYKLTLQYHLFSYPGNLILWS